MYLNSRVTHCPCPRLVNLSSSVFLRSLLRNLVSEEDSFQYKIYSYLVQKCETTNDDNLNMEDVCFFLFFFCLIIHTQTLATVATFLTEKLHSCLILAKSCIGSLIINTHTYTLRRVCIKTHWCPLFLLPLLLVPVISSFRASSVLL